MTFNLPLSRFQLITGENKRYSLFDKKKESSDIFKKVLSLSNFENFSSIACVSNNGFF